MANITRNFSLGILVLLFGYSEESTQEKFLENFRTYFRKNSDIFSEIFRHILGIFPCQLLEYFFYSRRIFLGIFPRKFLVQTELFAWREQNNFLFTKIFTTLLEKVFFFSFGFRSRTEKVSKM
jgi:hypothetical protein